MSAEAEIQRVRAEEKEAELTQAKAQLMAATSLHDRTVQEVRQQLSNTQKLVSELRESEEQLQQELDQAKLKKQNSKYQPHEQQ